VCGAKAGGRSYDQGRKIDETAGFKVSPGAKPYYFYPNRGVGGPGVALVRAGETLGGVSGPLARAVEPFGDASPRLVRGAK
jgi:hypothetical protein